MRYSALAGNAHQTLRSANASAARSVAAIATGIAASKPPWNGAASEVSTASPIKGKTHFSKFSTAQNLMTARVRKAVVRYPKRGSRCRLAYTAKNTAYKEK